MELYASMVENPDFHVGRLIEYLRLNELYENTLIVFMSGNGAAGEDLFNVGRYAPYLRANSDNSCENFGKPASWVSYGPQRADAGSAPHSRYKGYTREGGIVAPMIVTGAGVNGGGRIDHTDATVMDGAPTFLELAGGEFPTDASVEPMLGESMADCLRGEEATVHGDDYVTTLYHGDRAYIRHGNWKRVNLERPFDESKFELFDLSSDPGETRNLALVEPERLADMIELRRITRRQLGIVLAEDI